MSRLSSIAFAAALLLPVVAGAQGNVRTRVQAVDVIEQLGDRVPEDGRLSRYLYGIEYPARDMKLALVEAGKGRVGTAFDRVLLTCFKYDLAKRSYAPYALAFVRIGALLVFAALVALLIVLWRQDLKLKKQRGATA